LKKPYAHTFISGASRRLQQAAGPGFALQFLSPPAAGLRDFRFTPLRAQGLFAAGTRFKKLFRFP
jgi:hypothetical protein